MTIPSKILVKTLQFINFKKFVAKSFQQPPRKPFAVPYKLLKEGFNLLEFTTENGNIVTLIPKNKPSDTHILFFHGGAYVLQGSAMHWNFIKTIALKANCTVSYIDYPLAPECTFRQTFSMINNAYELLTKQFPMQKFMLMGDSAGGGLAMAFAQQLIENNAIIQPIKTILFSPWLDISLKNEEVLAFEKSDPILPLKALVEIGKKYAGGEAPENKLLSPIYGNLESMCPTLLFYGTNELFYPDCEKLREMTHHNPKFSYQLFKNMPHDWVILPVPEAQKALDIAVDFILST